tara:strand:- start:523 stop:837 length:315 start_codon:yes stop_codon:yes gene_type:complete
MPKGYVIGLIKFTDRQQFIENFAIKVGSLIQKSGGRFLTRRPESHFREGRKCDLHVIAEFDEFDQAKTLFQSEEWENIQNLRRAYSDPEYGTFMLIEGSDTIAG